MHLDNCTIYAVDFDGTLCENKFPEIGKPNTRLINWLIKKRENGDKVILWTNRFGTLLEKAVEWSKDKGLVFDAVNSNLPEIMEKYKDIGKGVQESQKITADIFIDDLACGSGLPFGNPKCPINSCWLKDENIENN